MFPSIQTYWCTHLEARHICVTGYSKVILHSTFRFREEKPYSLLEIEWLFHSELIHVWRWDLCFCLLSCLLTARSAGHCPTRDRSHNCWWSHVCAERWLHQNPDSQCFIPCGWYFIIHGDNLWNQVIICVEPRLDFIILTYRHARINPRVDRFEKTDRLLWIVCSRYRCR